MALFVCSPPKSPGHTVLVKCVPCEHCQRLDYLFSEITKSVWEEVYNKENIHSFRRQLQTLHIKYLKNIYIDDQDRFPHDSKSLARLHLGILSEKIELIIEKDEKSLDDYTLAHLLKSLDTIEQVLDSE